MYILEDLENLLELLYGLLSSREQVTMAHSLTLHVFGTSTDTPDELPDPGAR